MLSNKTKEILKDHGFIKVGGLYYNKIKGWVLWVFVRDNEAHFISWDGKSQDKVSSWDKKIEQTIKEFTDLEFYSQYSCYAVPMQEEYLQLCILDEMYEIKGDE